MNWREKFLFGLIIVVLSAPAWAINTYVTIPDGNLESLKAELESAQSNNSGTRIIRMGGTFLIGSDDVLPVVTTDVALFADQAPAYFIGEDGGPVNLIRVAGSGTLRITNVSFEGFHPIVTDGSAGAGLLVNQGTMELSELQFVDNTAAVRCITAGCDATKPLVLNTATGNLRMAQVSMVNSGVLFHRFLTGNVPGSF
ncbi:MAG TPA: hypothetical protein VJ984_01175, partial [Xanthomonadales bacterium]|nr:hypothetical protein [Xanthomonadales bacterium]